MILKNKVASKSFGNSPFIWKVTSLASQIPKSIKALKSVVTFSTGDGQGNAQDPTNSAS